jgi:hypothetical protein
MYMMMVVMRHSLSIRSFTPHLLPKLTTRFMPPKIIQPWESPLTAVAMVSAQHMLVFRSMSCHVPFEITALAVEVDVADRAVHPVAAVVGGHVLVTNVFVSE